MSRFALAGVAAAVVLAPSLASAAPIEFSEKRDNYWIFDDVDGSVENANWFFHDPFFAGYYAIEDGFLAAHPDDSQFLVVYTTFRLPAGIGALYQAVANDVEGIGYEHIAELDAVIPAPYFDETPNSQVSGFLHMNDWRQYLGEDGTALDDTRISLIMGQEFGHAWLAFPHFDDGAGPSSDLLGRADAHWSFYLHTGGSPVEGHQWVDNRDGTFTAEKLDMFQFSDLDLYLMGLIPSDEVAPWFLIENPTDCIDSALPNLECAPANAFRFDADSYTVTGTRRDITIDHVLAVEGPRVPAFPDAPDTYDTSFLLIKRADEDLSEESKLLMDAIAVRSIEIFEGQTRGLGHIVNRTGPDAIPPPTTGADDEGGSGSDSGSGTDGSEDGGQDGGSGDGTSSSCACRSDGVGAGLWAFAIGLLGWRRRYAAS